MLFYKKIVLIFLLFIVHLKLSAKTDSINYIIDGDSLVLNNGLEVRILDINTPEIYAKTKKNRKNAKISFEKLKQLLPKNKDVFLAYLTTKKDKYNRTLAYIGTKEIPDIGLFMIQNGLATPLIIGKSNKEKLYKDAFYQAKKDKIGFVGSSKTYFEPKNMPLNENIFIQGKIIQVSKKKSIFLTLDNGLKIIIAYKYKQNFASYDFDKLLKQQVLIFSKATLANNQEKVIFLSNYWQIKKLKTQIR